jgi:hypothetical protein
MYMPASYHALPSLGKKLSTFSSLPENGKIKCDTMRAQKRCSPEEEMV